MPQDNILSFAGNLALSPFYGLTESLANIGVPGAEEALNWGIFSGVPEFQYEHPGWAMGAELASYLIPVGAYAKATAKGAGIIGALTRAGAGLGGSNNTLRFALGETARFLPLNAGMTAFDTAAQRYDSPSDAVNSFAFNTLFGVGLSGLGASPTAHRILGSLPGVGPVLEWGAKNILGPSPELRTLYGIPEDIKPPNLDALISQFDPTSPTQLWGRDALRLLDEVRSGSRTDIKEPDLLNVIDDLRRESIREDVGPGEGYVRLPTPTLQATRNFLNREFKPSISEGGRRREMLTVQPGRPNDIKQVEKDLALPPNWEFMGRYFRHISMPGEKNARSFRSGIGLTPTTKASHGFRRIDREVPHIGPDGEPTGKFFQQTWAIRQEDDGMWILSTELPQAGGHKRFLMFKTDEPDFFFPKNAWMRNIDNAVDIRGMSETLGARAWNPIDNLPEKVAPFFDQARELKKTIFNADNFRAYERASRVGLDTAGELAKRFRLAGDIPGLNVGRFIESYVKPTMFQFRNNPEAAYTYQFSRAIFDAGEALKQQLVYGKQSLSKDKNVLSAIFGRPNMEGDSIYSMANRLLDETELEKFRRQYFEDQIPIDQWAEGGAKEFAKYVRAANGQFVDEYNKTLDAIGEEKLSVKPDHVGLGHHYDGSNFYPIYDLDNKVVALGVAHSAEGALREAQRWIDWKRNVKGDTRDFRIGEHFTSENFSALPKEVREAFFTPGFYRPQHNVGGFKWEREAIKSVEELVQAFDKSYSARTRHLADRVANALTFAEKQKVFKRDPATAQVLSTRLNALKGVPGAFDRLQNRIVDSALAPVLGVNSASKIVHKLNEVLHHLSFGMGNIGYPILNVTSLFQTSLPEITNILASTDDDLARMAYYLPTPGANGKPRGITAIYHAPGSLWRATGILKNPTDAQREIFERLAQDADLGPRFTEEYLGQNRSAILRISEGIKNPDDFVKWLGALSNAMPAQTEKFARAYSAAMALDAFERLAKIRGVEFTPEQMFRNVQNFVRRTNYLYSTADRPQIFTTPVGSLFGGFKNWMMHYLFAMADYTDLAARGNYAPLLMATSSMAGLGGLTAIPFLMGGLDWTTETFADKDVMEYLYENLGDGANGIAFGLPAALGVSLSGQTAAPGSHFAHDVDFLFSVMALERMKNAARTVGRYWDNSVTLGRDPWSDPVFRQQMLQSFAPRSLYRTYDVLIDDSLNSATTGYPMVDNLTAGQRWMHALGFTSTQVEREYAVYDRLMRDKEAMQAEIGLFGAAYAEAMLRQDQDLMEDIIRTAAARGLDLSRVLRSAQRRARDASMDMFGRSHADVSAFDAILAPNQ